MEGFPEEEVLITFKEQAGTGKGTLHDKVWGHDLATAVGPLAKEETVWQRRGVS